MIPKVSDEMDSDEEEKGKRICKYHGTCGHTTKKCTALETLIKQTKQKRSNNFKKQTKYTRQEVNVMVERKAKKTREKREYNEKLCTF